MKVAYLIQCHRDPILINKLITELDNVNSDFYIHVDKRSMISEDILNANNVFLIQNRFCVDWGSVNQIYATLELLKQANKKNYDYVSLISGQDYPIKSIDNLIEFLECNKGSEFIEFFRLPNKSWNYEGGIGRVKYHWWNFLTPKKSLLAKIMRNSYLLTLGKWNSKDISMLGDLYGGSQWFTITGNLVSYICDFINFNPNYLKMYKNSGCSDEIFFQTLIMNSPFKNKVVNNNLRFIKWEIGKSSPSILTISHEDEIIKSNKFFMRKVDSILSKDLIIKFSKS